MKMLKLRKWMKNIYTIPVKDKIKLLKLKGNSNMVICSHIENKKYFLQNISPNQQHIC